MPQGLGALFFCARQHVNSAASAQGLQGREESRRILVVLPAGRPEYP